MSRRRSEWPKQVRELEVKLPTEVRSGMENLTPIKRNIDAALNEDELLLPSHNTDDAIITQH